MEVLKDILSKLKDDYFNLENYDLSDLGDTDISGIIHFVLEKSGYDKNNKSLNNYYVSLCASAISNELLRGDNYGSVSFDVDSIIDVLRHHNDDVYLEIYRYYVQEIKYLEYHTVNGKELFFGENLKIEFEVLLSIFSSFISAELDLVLLKVKNKILNNTKPKDWYGLILGKETKDNKYSLDEKERIDSIIKNVLS